jgi:hypothetical protein
MEIVLWANAWGASKETRTHVAPLELLAEQLRSYDMCLGPHLDV